MSSIKVNDSNKTGMLRAITIGTTIATLICCIAVLTGPILILNEYLELKLVRGMAMIVLSVGTSIGAMIAGAGVNKNRWIAASATAGVFYIILVSSGILFFEINTGSFLAGLLCCAVGAGVSLLILNKKSTRNKKRKKYRSR